MGQFTAGHALVIGVGTHQYHPAFDVPIAVADAKAVAAVLRDESACGYPAGQVRPLGRGDATKKGILSALDDLAAGVGPQDTVFLFYCGHGALGTDGNYYLVSHDARLEGGRVVAGTGVSEGELLQKVHNIKAERMLMVFNACHSGHISPSLGPEQETFSSNPDEDSASALLATGAGRIIIVACRERQVSYAGNGALSVFTQALVDGLRGKGIRNSNGFISAFSLYEHVYEWVSETVKIEIGAIQEPELTVLRGVGPFAVSLFRGASSSGGFAADEPLPQGMALREVSPEKSERRFAQRVIVANGPVATHGSAISTGSGTAVVGNNNVVISGKIGRNVKVKRGGR